MEKEDIMEQKTNEDINSCASCGFNDFCKEASTDDILEGLGGCGRFQICLGVLLSLNAIPGIFSYRVMAYGMYNPGWTCMDNELMSNSGPDNGTAVYRFSNMSMIDTFDNTTLFETYNDHGYGTPSNVTGLMTDNQTSNDPPMSCPIFDSCKNVVFNSGARTIVSEFGLTCDRAWILNTILSVQMAGNVCSTLFVGYIGDRFGRKIPYIISRLVHMSLDLISVFSVNWEMYAATMFLMGFNGSFGVLSHVIMMEYVSANWRVRINSVPTYSIISIIFALVAMATRDWRFLKITAVALGVIIIIPVFWMPKSLRWLFVNRREKEAIAVAKKISKVNKAKSSFTEDRLESLISSNIKAVGKKKTYKMYHLFRKGYRMTTVLVGLLTLLLDMLYFVFSFGISALPGNIYINMIIFSVCDIPSSVISFSIANIFRRKPSMFVFFLLVSCCLFGVVAMDLETTGQLKTIGILVLVLLAKLFVYIAWIILYTVIMEVFPTVVRSTVNSYAMLLAGVGGVIAPYIIPTNPATFYISYIVMAILSIVGACLVLLLPETKDVPLKDAFEDEKLDKEANEQELEHLADREYEESKNEKKDNLDG